MNNCKVCLTNADVFSGINSTSSEWQEGNIQRIIEKHLWWWYSKQSSPDHLSWICRQCWQELLSFHMFYKRVERVHKQYGLLKSSAVDGKDSTIKLEPTLEGEVLEIKEEFVSSEYDSDENLVPLTTRKLIEGKKSSIKSLSDNIKTENNTCYNNETAAIENDMELLVCKSTASTSTANENSMTATSKNDMELLVPKKEFVTCESTSSTFNTDEDSMTSEISDEENDMEHKSSKKNHSKMNSNITKTTNQTVSYPENKIYNSKIFDTPFKSELTRKITEYLDKTEYKFNCHLCKTTLTDFRELLAHFRSEHKSRGYAVCCNKKFYNRGPLVDHLRLHEDPNYFKCPQCKRALSHRVSFEKHLKYHKLSSESSSYSCDKCEKYFSKKSDYDRHILTHPIEEETDFKNANNDVELETKSLPNRGKKEKNITNNEIEVICPHCSKVSPTMHAHRQHIAYAHTMEHKYACNVCEKKFRRALELEEHLTIHTGKPLYSCPHCSRTFNFSANLHKHRKAIHPKEWHESKLKRQWEFTKIAKKIKS